ncbi:hypothetical protein [Albidovulum sediminis]|uniref:Uncharacterized protein n=1 Tax=Albidovulum sediminis TaxID=3066345 RepID=A0ABT2NN62_9RHOB|nr:hypothetical protein [Defluviimonas sediminis]MCT8330368.1 hypothetical protein [Defluviimonas sediminis]
MGKVSTGVALLCVFGAGAAAADDKFTIVYEKAPWTVFKFVGTDQGDPPDYCSARSARSTGFLELIGQEATSCVSAEDQQWTFSKRTDEVGFFIGSSGFYVSNGNYFSNGLQICAETAAIDSLIDAIWSAKGDRIDAYDFKHRKIGSFPGSGRSPALKAWRACRDAL